MLTSVERSYILKAYELTMEPERRSTLNCAFFLLFLSTPSIYRLFP